MRTKHTEKKRELENAFSFGQHRNENVYSPTKGVKGVSKQSSTKLDSLFERQLYDKTKFAVTGKKQIQREPLQKLRNNGEQFQTNKEDELLKRFEDYEKKFELGKVIQSETVEEPDDTIIEPLQKELFSIRAEQEKEERLEREMLEKELQREKEKLKKEQRLEGKERYKCDNSSNMPSKHYDPSIQEIKKKYGYIPDHKIFQKPKAPQATRTHTPTRQIPQFKSHQTSVNIHHTSISSKPSPYENYSNKYSRSPNLKTTQNSTTTRNIDISHHSKTLKSQENYDYFAKHHRDRIRTFDIMETKSSKALKALGETEYPSLVPSLHSTQHPFEQSTDWVLRSINELDCRISEKMNRIMPQVNGSMPRRY